MSADKRESSSLASEYYSNYLYGTDISSAIDYVAIMKHIVNSTTLGEVNRRMKELLPEANDNMVIGCWSIEKDSAYYPSEKELEAALFAGRKAPTSPYTDNLKDAKLLNGLPNKGFIVKNERFSDLDYTKLTLSNGAVVLLKHTDIDKSQVLFKAYGKGGWTLYGEDQDPNILMLGHIPFGNNGLSSSQVEKLLAGKRVHLSQGISQRYFSLTGSANPVDLETLMQMIYARFTNVSKDSIAYQKAIRDMAIYLNNRKTDPESAFSDSVSVTSNGHHPRFKLLAEEDLAKVSNEGVLSIIQDQTSAPRNYTFLFVGNYEEPAILPLIEQYLASIPNKKELPEGHFIKTWLKEDAYCHFKRQMETPKAMVNMDWFTESIPYTLENNVTVQAICEMLNLLYNKIVREENSATYGCYADYYIIRGEKEEYQIGFTADCEMHPEKCDSVLALMKNTFSSMADSIDRTIFSSAKESLLKSLDELEKTKNGFWLDIIWKKENRGIDLYINRIQHIKQLTPYKIQQFLKHFLKTSHFSATLMEPK
jgi:zinc protease